jgi:hypothetical protein
VGSGGLLSLCGILVIGAPVKRGQSLRAGASPVNRQANFAGVAPSMMAIGMIAVFLIAILALNKFEFGRFD